MRPSEILDDNRARIRSIVRELGADNPLLFGSAARGDMASLTAKARRWLADLDAG